MGTVFIVLVAFVVGYYVFLIFSHPEKKKSKLPRIAYRNIEVSPNIKIHFRNRTYHLHHWLVLTLMFLGSLYFIDGLVAVKAAGFGGIVQGLRYSDRFKIRHPRSR